jgi:hypothetical protein
MDPVSHCCCCHKRAPPPPAEKKPPHKYHVNVRQKEMVAMFDQFLTDINLERRFMLQLQWSEEHAPSTFDRILTNTEKSIAKFVEQLKSVERLTE